MSQPPFEALERLVDQSATGEFVCVAEDCETHVYLQHGRVAWATDSQAPLAFRTWLLENTPLTLEVFQEVLESCRRDRLPLGETLIEWKVVSRDEIRSALRFQIGGALTALAACSNGSTIFLERARAYATYDSRLTFELDELVVPPPRESSVFHGSGLLDRLASEIPEHEWLELLEGNVSLARVPTGTGTWSDHALARASVLDGAELVAFRSSRGTLLGVALAPERSVWCRLGPEVAFGRPLSTLCSTASVDIKTTPPTGFDPAAATSRGNVVSGAAGPVVEALEAFLVAEPDVLGAVVTHGGHVRASALRKPWDPRAIGALVTRRAPLLAAEMASSRADRPLLHEGTQRLRSVVTAERNLWCFGAELGGPGQRAVWLVLDRGSAQGLGWAFLATLARQVSTVEIDTISEGWPKIA